MAFLRGRNEEEGTPTPGEVAPPPASGPGPVAALPARPASTPLSAFIDQGSEFEGKLTFKDTVRIDGTFRGEVASQNTLVVGETGEVMATIRSKSVVVLGNVTGDVFASERLVLHKTARLEGDVEAGSLAIEEGAVFNGKVTMKGAPSGRSGASLESVSAGASQASKNG